MPTNMHVHDHTHELTLGLSFFLGALHALEPGHGKTALLAVMLDGQRNVWHPFVMGISTAAAHSVSMLAIIFGVQLTQFFMSAGDQDRTFTSALQWISASIVMVVGLAALRNSLRGRDCCAGDHQDLCCGQSGSAVVILQPASPGSGLLTVLPDSGAGQQFEVKGPARTAGLRPAVLLGFAVGLVPCPTALAACFSGLAAGDRVAVYATTGLFLVGIACALAICGMVLQFVGNRVRQQTAFLRAIPWPVIRAAVILGTGTLSCLRLFVYA